MDPDRRKHGRRKTDGPLVSRIIVAGYLILAAGVVLGLVAAYHNAQRNDQTAACLSAWANDTSNRALLLTDLAADRSHRLDLLIRDVAQFPRLPARRSFRRDIVLYINSSDAYDNALRTHPAPPPPAVRC